MPQPWKNATRRAAEGVLCLPAQRWNVRPAKRGIGARWWRPSVFSTASRSSRLRSAQFASGATGVPRRPASVGRATIRSRSGTPRVAFRCARACVLISAMWTPCGQTCVQMPQPEQ